MNIEISKERMLEMAKKLASMDFCPEQRVFYKNILRMVKADVEGRLLVLPCRVGDTVYEIIEETVPNHYFYINDFNKFMNYKKKQEKGKEKGKVDTVRNEMDRTMGKGGAKYIKTLMNRLVTASGLSDDSDFAKMLVRNMKVASVGANLRVIVQQPTAYLRAGNSLSMKYLLNPAVFKKTDKETIYKYAPIALWKSWGNYEMDTGKTMYEQMIAPTKAARTKELLMAGAGWADEVTWSRLWNAEQEQGNLPHGKGGRRCGKWYRLRWTLPQKEISAESGTRKRLNIL